MEELDELVGKLLVVCGDLNGHVCKESEGFEEVHRGHGYGNRNREGRNILEMAQQRELVVCNTWYRKKNILSPLAVEAGVVRLTIYDDVISRHTLPVFTGLGRCPIVSWDFLLEQ